MRDMQICVPFLQRIHTQYALRSGGKFQVWGISQNDAEETAVFAKEYGNADISLLLDSQLDVSAEYRITNVPDLYLLSEEDTIPLSVVGYFGKEAFNALAETVAQFLNVPYTPIVREEDNAPQSNRVEAQSDALRISESRIQAKPLKFTGKFADNPL